VALVHGQAIAALSCELEGARGAMYHFTRTKFLEAVSIIEGKAPSVRKERKISLSQDFFTSTICPRCNPDNPLDNRQHTKPSHAHLITKALATVDASR
jgi:hypothetical protein